MRIVPLVAILLLCSCSRQVIISNETGKRFTNLYIIDYNTTLKTVGACSTITNVNLLKRTIESKKKEKVDFKLNPKKHYNLVCFDTTEYPNFYQSVSFLYYLPGGEKEITIKDANVETDFQGHCMETVMNHDNEDLNANIINKGYGNIIKFYIRFNERDPYQRYNDFYQWTPVTQGMARSITLYNTKPEGATNMYVKCYTEEAGKISETDIHLTLKPRQRSVDIEVP